MGKKYKIEIDLSLILSAIALILASATFYYQFFHIKKELYITPIKPLRVATVGDEVGYKFIISNPGNSPIMLVNSYYNLNHGKHLTMVMKDPDRISIPILPNTSYEQIIKVEKKRLDEYTTQDFNVYFYFVDPEGEYIEVTMPLCFVNENDALENPKNKCYKRIKVI